MCITYVPRVLHVCELCVCNSIKHYTCTAYYHRCNTYMEYVLVKIDHVYCRECLSRKAMWSCLPPLFIYIYHIPPIWIMFIFTFHHPWIYFNTYVWLVCLVCSPKNLYHMTGSGLVDFHGDDPDLFDITWPPNILIYYHAGCGLM